MPCADTYLESDGRKLSSDSRVSQKTANVPATPPKRIRGGRRRRTRAGDRAQTPLTDTPRDPVERRRSFGWTRKLPPFAGDSWAAQLCRLSGTPPITPKPTTNLRNSPIPSKRGYRTQSKRFDRYGFRAGSAELCFRQSNNNDNKDKIS